MQEAGIEAQKDVLDQMGKPDDQDQEPEKLRKSDRFDAMALARRVQAGVGGDDQEQKKQTNLLDQSVKYLAKIAQARGMDALDFEVN